MDEEQIKMLEEQVRTLEETNDILTVFIAALLERNNGSMLVRRSELERNWNRRWTYVVEDGNVLFAYTDNDN